MSKIAKESAIFFAGTLIPAAISFISVPIFTRYFTPQEYGVNALIDTSFGYANTLLFSMIGSIVWRYYNDYKAKNRVDIFFGIISFLVRISIFLILLGTGVIVLFSKYDSYTKKLLITKAFALLFGAYVSVYGIVLRLDGKSKAFNVIQIFNSLANFALIYMLTKALGMRNIAMYVSGIITSVCAGSFLLWYFRKQKRTYLPLKQMIVMLMPLLSYASIALLSNFVQNILDSSDRYMISGLVDVMSTGLYDKLYGISNRIMAIFSTVFMNLFTPYVYKSLSEKKADEFFKELMPVYVGIFLPLVMYYSVFADTICTIMLAKEYSNWYFILPCISLGYFFISVASFPEMVIRFEKPKFVPIGYCGALVLNIILNAVLIPRLNILGAAIGTAASYLFVLVYFSVVAKTAHFTYFFTSRKKVNLLFLIPVIECFAYQFVIKQRLSISPVICVILAAVMAASYFLPYLYYYFVRNKRFVQLFEEK